MSSHSTIPPSFLHSFFQGAESLGFSPSELLLQCDIAPDAMEDDGQPISLTEFNRLISYVWVLLDDESAGFHSRPVKPGGFAMSCQASITCPTLRQALKRIARFYTLLQVGVDSQLEEKGEEAIITFDLGNPKNLDLEFMVMTLFVIRIRWASWLIDKPLLLERICVTFDKPEWADTFDNIFPCRHYFNQPVNSFVFNRRFLDMPNVQTPQSLSEFLADAPARLLTHYHSDNSLTASVQRMLKNEDAIERLSFEIVAERLLTTTQTLRRRLKEEGNTYQEIKDAVRRDMAVYHLLKLNTPINDIVSLMGFSEPSAFTRAFKKWTGMTPGSYRESHQAK